MSEQKFSSSQNSQAFQLVSPYKPAGDQGKVIDEITESLEKGNFEQTILGVTGSGKTYMMASIINNLQKPTLILAHNKTLAAQLAEEFKRFFPNNAVHYFVSYYDYYQPESYIPRSDTFIEKQTQINAEIERLRNATTQALLTRKDVIIVASVSCIYGLGDPEDFKSLKIELEVGGRYKLDKLTRKLIDLQFIRTSLDLQRGSFRLRGDNLEIAPAGEELGYRFGFYGDELERIESFEIVSGHTIEVIQKYNIFPAKQYVTTQEKVQAAIPKIEKDLIDRVDYFNKTGMLLPAERLKQRTLNDIEMLRTLGFVSGIENYSIYFDGRENGEAPGTLLDYFPDDSLTFVDESHMTLSQVAAMYSGDKSRKDTLVEYGFRLPSALNNRPLKIKEFFQKQNQIVYVSATPSDFEFGVKNSIGKGVEGAEIERKNEMVVSKAIIRPTGLVDPVIVLKPVANQVDDILEEVRQCVAKGQRVLITTLTKKFSEELDIYFKQIQIKSAYIHSDVETLDRLDILSDLRRGKYDVLIGINLLREGLDLPEVSLVGIFDADKEGFLRSKTSLIQIIGRAARHSNGKVIMYADNITNSMRQAIDETEARRKIQLAYNLEHNIVPTTTIRELKTISDEVKDQIEENQDWGKAGAKYSVTGWDKTKPEEDEMKIESRYTRTSRPAKSAYTATRQAMAREGSGKQVFDAFDAQKEAYLVELRQLNLSSTEIQERLQIAIDAMDFEMAAALRDFVKEREG
jgi:excinuclease ABC subunit B